MESSPISNRLPEPLVRAARESAKRRGRDSRRSDEELREEFRQAREQAKGDSETSLAMATARPSPVVGENQAAAPKSELDSVDARGRRLDIRV